MADATNRTGRDFIVPPGVELASTDVDVRYINPALQSFLIKLGLVHLHLFGLSASICAGMGRSQCGHRTHGTGTAIDVSMFNLPVSDWPCFLLVVRVLCDTFHLVMCDLSALSEKAIVHVELAE